MQLHPWIGMNATTKQKDLTGTIVAIGQFQDEDGADVCAWLLISDGTIRARCLDGIVVDYDEAATRLAKP